MITHFTTTLVAAIAAAAHAQTTLSPSANVPAGSSKIVDRSFPSFGIQGSSFPFYTGSASNPNIFSQNLIANIENRTGAPLVVRVGGTNTDYSNYNPSQTEAVTPKQTGDGIGAKFVFGPSFYEGFKNWPNTRWIYDVPFAKKNQTLSLYQAQAALNGIGSDKLEALEIGNEPDLYVPQKARPDGYGPSDYASEWKSYGTWLTGKLGLSGPIFQGLTEAAPHPGGVWSAQAALEAGLPDRGQVKSISWHHYETTDTGSNIQSTLLSHSFITSGVDKYASDMQWVQANHPKIQLVFGESGRYAPGSANTSTDDSQGVFGAALWTSDYLLYLMTQNVTRVNMQLATAFGYVAWHPVSLGDTIKPSVRSPYFGHLLAAEFIGGSTAFQVAQVPTSSDQLAVYAGYDKGVLVRLVIINLNLWNGSGTRPSQNFAINVPSGTTSGTVKTLTCPYGATSLGYFYWAGLAFSYPNQGIGTKESSQPQPYAANVQNGQLTIPVGSSQAVLIELA